MVNLLNSNVRLQSSFFYQVDLRGNRYPVYLLLLNAGLMPPPLQLKERAVPYTPNPQHRNGGYAAVKSQWSISQPEEVACFDLAVQAEWAFRNSFWGLHIGAAGLGPLGVAPPPSSCQLHIAKFVGDAIGNWHGYPVAHWLSPYDKPSETILSSWFELGLISKPKMAKIHRGKQCAL